MFRFIEQPHLPAGKVRIVLIGKAYLDMLCLDHYGIIPAGVEKSDKLEPPVASHADMQVIHLYKNIFLSAPVDKCKVKEHYMLHENEMCCKAKRLVECETEFLLGSTILAAGYPRCAAYNVLLLNKLAVFNPKCIDIGLKTSLFELGYRSVHVKQGFARCSVCVVQKNAVITADAGIAEALRNEDIDVLLIRPGYICLPGYDTGFIGGATFKIAPDTLAFTGRIDGHPDQDQILAFLKKYGVYAVMLSDRPIFDIGSAIPMVEEVYVG